MLDIIKNVTNPTAHLSHLTIKDYILWFTKHGSIESEFYGRENYSNKIVYLKSFDTERIKPELKIGNEVYTNDYYEKIPFGHVFPPECYKQHDLTGKQADLQDQGKDVDKIDLICKRVYLSNETGKQKPDVPFQIVFYIEGDEAKRSYNKMLIPKGRVAKLHYDQYTVESRYGLWACKDFIPVVNITSWIETRGIKSRFHAFINCDKFELTANRSTIDNTPSDIISSVKERTKEIYREIIQKSDEYKEIERLIEEEEKQRQLEEDKKEFAKRIKNLSKLKKCVYKNITLFEPKTEAEVYGLIMRLMAVNPDLFDFEILDYRTDKGIDFLVRKKSDPPELPSYKYVELKHILRGSFNHCFMYLHKVICFKIEDGLNRVKGIDGIRIITSSTDRGETKFYLTPESPSPDQDNIEIIVLETFLREKLKLEFT
ncbi:hypothetical protein HPY86_03795 [candidate division WOR-3 bacterium]|nr:hypothetical protein [candidate division WOR-3 bacterium]